MSINISKQKRDELTTKIEAIRSFILKASQDENSESLLTFLGQIEKEVKGKKYGLVFEEHRETIDEVLDSHIPVLSEEPSLFIDNGGDINFLLEGDNLAGLRLLEKTYRRKIDLIYIDPPYNTGNKDFIYDDSFVDKTDSYIHSKWLSFMERRLRIAKNLLSENGSIFISIDEHEYANLRLLCNQIMGEERHVATIAWQKRYSRENREAIGDSHEYILIYAYDVDKFKKFRNKLPLTDKQKKLYKNPDKDPRGPWQSISLLAQGYRTNQMYKIIAPNGTEHYPPQGRCWSTIESEFVKAFNDGRIYFGPDGNGVPRRKQFLYEAKGLVPWSWWPHEEVGHTDEAKKETGAILENMIAFSTPKPIRLIDRIITIASGPSSTILDFFAGSGTTGQAVLAYNAVREKSKRKFILCTNNENGICRKVTYERIKRVIANEGYSASLKYYKIDYVSISERMYYEYADELLLHIRELVELENGVNFTRNADLAIVLTDDEMDEFVENADAFEKCVRLYKGHDVLLSGEQEELLKERGVEIITIPNYFYKELEG